MMNCPKQPALVCPIDAIGASACLMAAFSGICKSHEPSPSDDVRGIVPPHCNGHQNDHHVLFAVALASDGVIRSK